MLDFLQNFHGTQTGILLVLDCPLLHDMPSVERTRCGAAVGRQNETQRHQSVELTNVFAGEVYVLLIRHRDPVMPGGRGGPAKFFCITSLSWATGYVSWGNSSCRRELLSADIECVWVEQWGWVWGS